MIVQLKEAYNWENADAFGPTSLRTFHWILMHSILWSRSQWNYQVETLSARYAVLCDFINARLFMLLTDNDYFNPVNFHIPLTPLLLKPIQQTYPVIDTPNCMLPTLYCCCFSFSLILTDVLLLFVLLFLSINFFLYIVGVRSFMHDFYWDSFFCNLQLLLSYLHVNLPELLWFYCLIFQHVWQIIRQCIIFFCLIISVLLL